MLNKRKTAKIMIWALLLQLLIVGRTTAAPEYTASASSWGEAFSKDEFIAERINYAISLYGPGDYFSKNGKACTCHNRCNCVANGSSCNCLRYVYIDGVKCDLRAVQCMGYAMFFEQVLFGCNEFSHSSRYKNISGPGTLKSSSDVKKWFAENAESLHPGMHIRVNYSQHSIVFMAVDFDKGTVTYIDNNWVGKCKISNFTTLTWSEFRSKFHSINYAKMYKNYYSYFEGAPNS